MLKRLTLIAILGSVLLSCGQVKEQQTESAGLSNISQLVSEPMGYEGTEVSFEGVITHICQHSGDKIRVNQVDDNAYSVIVMLEDFKPEFNAEFEGKRIRVSGILKTEVANMDELEATHTHAHEGEGEAGHECTSTEEAVKALQEKGITPDISVYIEMTKYEIIEATTQGCPGQKAVEVAETTTKKCC